MRAEQKTLCIKTTVGSAGPLLPHPDVKGPPSPRCGSGSSLSPLRPARHPAPAPSPTNKATLDVDARDTIRVHSLAETTFNPVELAEITKAENRKKGSTTSPRAPSGPHLSEGGRMWDRRRLARGKGGRGGEGAGNPEGDRGRIEGSENQRKRRLVEDAAK